MKIAEATSQTVHVESLNTGGRTWALTTGLKVLTTARDRYNLIDDCNRIRGHICADCTFGPACSFFPKAAA
jgi:hypothetical protein